MVSNPSRKQTEALVYLTDGKTNFIGYGGAAFGGKSYLACAWMTHMALKYPDTGWGLGRKELVNLKKTTLKTLFKVFDEMKMLPERDYHYNGQLNIITLANKSEIFLIDTAFKPSDELYTRFGGYELTGAAIDESAETPLQAINILFTRLGRRNNSKYGLTKKLLETFNPSKGHVYSRYYKPWKEGSLKETYAFIPAFPQDNPSPEVEDYVRGIIANGDKVTIERLIHGNFEYDDDPAKLIDYDCIVNLFSNTHVPGGKKYITADIARLGSDKAVVMVWDGLTVIEIQEMAKGKLTDLQAIITQLKNKHSVVNSHIIADEDGVGGGVVDNLRIKGFVNNSSALQDENYANLKSQCYFKLAEAINKGNVYIKASTTLKQKEDIISELEQVKQDRVDSDSKLKVIPKATVKEILGRSPDYSDTMMMRMFFELSPQSFKAPKVHLYANS